MSDEPTTKQYMTAIATASQETAVLDAEPAIEGNESLSADLDGAISRLQDLEAQLKKEREAVRQANQRHHQFVDRKSAEERELRQRIRELEAGRIELCKKLNQLEAKMTDAAQQAQADR